MNLQQKLVADAMKEAGRKVAIIDANAGLIAETEALAEALRVALRSSNKHTVVANAVAGSTGVIAWVQISNRRRSEALGAIERAGLQVATEHTEPNQPDQIHFTLEGFDVPVWLCGIVQELAEAA